MVSRKEHVAAYLRTHDSIFACPICRADLIAKIGQSLICRNNHTFDIAKQGYVNTLTHPVKSNYEKSLFEARREMIKEVGLYEPLHERINEILREQAPGIKDGDYTYLLDAGTGEGSHLEQVLRMRESNFVGVGVDLAKEGVRLAATVYEGIWLVADLANMPVKDHMFSAVLNILSPANYEEFKRVLRQHGLLIKVVPGSTYLKELREFAFQEEEKKTYQNDKTVARFKEKFKEVHVEKITYTKRLQADDFRKLIQMTPLTWSSDQEAIMNTVNEEMELTIDLDILIGRKQ
jgi:23S rRNA (guanine745-N1)-methyltransferase